MNQQVSIVHAFDFLGKDLDDLLQQFSAPVRSHSRRVAVCSAIMAEYVAEFPHLYDTGPTENKLAELVHLGGTCHDIGKLLLPALSCKTADYMRHPLLGAELLEEHKDLFSSSVQAQVVLDMVRYHHEQPDGNGFPEGLRAKSIPLTAAICAVANHLDYCISLEEPTFQDFSTVLERITGQSGILFCEAAVSCLEQAWPRLIAYYQKIK